MCRRPNDLVFRKDYIIIPLIILFISSNDCVFHTLTNPRHKHDLLKAVRVPVHHVQLTYARNG